MIVGRSGELERLGGLLDGAVAARAGALLLHGDPGMGKSTIMAAAERLGRRRGFRIVRAAAPEGGAELPFGIVEDLVRGMPEVLAGLGPEDEDLMRRLPFLTTAHAGRVSGAFLRLLARASDSGPVLLLLDDLHWADAASLSVLTLASGRLQAEPVVMVGAARPRPVLVPGLAHWEHLAVDPLPVEAAIGVFRASVPITLAPRITATQAMRVVTALGRCPLAIVECTRLLSDAELTGLSPLPDPIPLDEQLMAAWAGAYQVLPDRARGAVLAVCVVHATVQGLLDEVLSDCGLAPSDLDPAIDARLVVLGTSGGSTAVPGLVHPLLRSAILATAAADEARAMHLRTATAAAALGLAPSLVIAHLAAGATRESPELAERLVEEAQRALDHGQVEACAQALQAAARLYGPSPQRQQLAARGARELLSGSLSVAPASPLLELLEGAELAGEDAVWVEWLRAECAGLSDMRESLVALDAAAQLARRAGSTVEPLILWSATETAWAVDDGLAALEHSTALCRWLDAEPARCELAPAWAGLALMGASQFQLGLVGEAEQSLAAASRRSAGWEPDGEGAAALLNVVLLDGYLVPARRTADRDLGLAARRFLADRGETLSYIRQVQAQRALMRGDTVVARALLDESLELARSTPIAWGVAARLCAAVALGAVTGEGELVGQWAAELRGIARQIGVGRFQRHADRAEGLLALGEGRLDDALARLEPLTADLLLGPTPAAPVLTGRADLVEALVHAGDLASARLVAADLHRVLGPSTNPYAVALLARSSALLGHGPQAQASFRVAIDAFGLAGDTFEGARTRLLLGERLRRDRMGSEARRELRLAASALDLMGARPWRERALAELRAAGSSIPELTGDPWSTLSSQELRVVTAVAQGASNRQAAAALFLSTRTVEYHLATAYRKLGVGNRTALAHSLAVRTAMVGVEE